MNGILNVIINGSNANISISIQDKILISIPKIQKYSQ